MRRDLEVLYTTGAVQWSCRESKEVYDMVTLVEMGVSLRDIAGDTYREDLNYLLFVRDLKAQASRSGLLEGFRRVG
ncbi:hypothetical protein NWT39_13225 [Nitrososphaera viennensis]|uniref:Uncharacterized protein n=2 Tax=Nitrososphaera viennensis TaxID=1034015 RepID=A0A060HNC3_9ARCH|nr:hypothetical protein [Nitrososphaera viennensis]AIC16953.1 hypothetical protein NVIE_026810 [Nitrososphaera viennensis EN76]UVS68856.1 hypothetical protein NWT39_13225 [Nitrososphaera viennensis]CBX88963.1 hypothetical protein [Nitrososphaera phage Pro-Nvie1]